MVKIATQSIKTVAFVSLGCPKNLVDSERMLGLIAQDGLTISADAGHADAIIINTCGFLEASKTESLAEIRQAVDFKTRGKCKRVIVAGCLVQRHKTDLLSEVPGIDRLVGVFDREHIVQAVRGQENPRQAHGHFLGKYHDLSRELNPSKKTAHGKAVGLPVFEDDRGRLRLTPRHYAYLRISEGCNQGCTFCTIPSIRGPMRSKPIDQLIAEARELASDGAVELNLIGQDTTSYGTDIGYAAGLAGMLRKLDRELKDVRWLRLMYAYPSCFTDEMIDAIADCDRVVKYIDMPLQHINDELLATMRRRVTRKQTEVLLSKLRKRIPGIAIRTTFIAGAPGETDQQHAELVQFVKDFGFDMMGVFPYSQEPGTAMGRLPDQVPDEIKQRRVEELMLAQQDIAFGKARALVGKEIEALIDAPGGPTSAGLFNARSQSQAPDIDSVVKVQGKKLHAGQFVNVRIIGASGYDLEASPVVATKRSLPVLA
ncbi:MAG TPA: 30S ribosomal protein S12 methylthiotransferase RimO [Tepidisphaeraceae bacterium]|nr:30S ribosomal protein S12 methylthiotransferase RimO [Tepidisphaeraceae bacterium]